MILILTLRVNRKADMGCVPPDNKSPPKDMKPTKESKTEDAQKKPEQIIDRPPQIVPKGKAEVTLFRAFSFLSNCRNISISYTNFT